MQDESARAASSPIAGRLHVRDRQQAVVAHRGLAALGGDGLRDPLGVGAAHDHDLLGAALDELLGGAVGDQPAAADDDEVVGGDRHLVHQVAGDEDRAALGGQPLHQVPDPDDALGVEPVDRLVEDEDRRVAEQRGGDAEPLAHAEREAARALAGDP